MEEHVNTLKQRIDEIAGGIVDRLIEIRHDIHQHPEIRYEEFRTANTVEAFLDEIGVSHKRCTETGVVALIGKEGGRVVGIRSELDALPMPDQSGLPYASVNDNTCHACGHDGHIVNLLGAAYVLKHMEDELTGMVKLIWQPAEEGGAGANAMVQAGVLDNPKVDAIFGMHGWPSMPLGKAGYRFGPTMASTDDFRITVRGRGTHGAMPHGGIDPIAIAAQIVQGLQNIRSRMINPIRPLVITVGTIHGGTAVNVIPDDVVMTGTIRTLDPATREEVPKLMDRMTSNIARSAGGEGVFELTAGYPPTINEDKATAFARDTITEILGEDNVVEIPDPVMGGEDFAFYLEKIPGSFMRLGMGERPALHNTSYDYNDKAIPTGIAVYTAVARRFLEKGF